MYLLDTTAYSYWEIHQLLEFLIVFWLPIRMVWIHLFAVVLYPFAGLDLIVICLFTVDELNATVILGPYYIPYVRLKTAGASPSFWILFERIRMNQFFSVFILMINMIRVST